MPSTPQLALAAVLSGAALAVQILAGAVPSMAAASPSPSPSFQVGEAVPPSSGSLPSCSTGVDNTYVLISEGRAVVVSGTGHFVQQILAPGGAYDDGSVRLRFNTDGKSITYTPQGERQAVTEVCKPGR